jgi:hypothetical protein
LDIDYWITFYNHGILEIPVSPPLPLLSFLGDVAALRLALPQAPRVEVDRSLGQGEVNAGLTRIQLAGD